MPEMADQRIYKSVAVSSQTSRVVTKMLYTSNSAHLNSAHLPLPFLFAMLTIQWPLNVDTFGTVLKCPVYRGVLISGVCI